VIAKAKPAGGVVPEVETLKLHLDMLKRESDTRTTALNAALVRIAAAATSGSLVFGIYTALRPRGVETLATGWVIGALLPFLGLILTSLFRPAGIRSWLADQVDDSSTRVEDFAAWTTRRRTGELESEETITAPGATYETFDRLTAARHADPWHPEALLPQRDWLMIEIRRQRGLLVAYREAVKKAERSEQSALAWLAVLVIYIVLITFLA
jgi:hypothetical protein